MKDLKANIENAKELAEVLEIAYADTKTQILLENQIAMMEALQDIQEKMLRIEGKMRGIK
jgi:hypothetical protein